MRLQVKGKNVEITPSVREYAETKLAKLDKQLAGRHQVELELSEEKQPVDPRHHVAEGTIFTKGPTLRARESAPDIRTSIDRLVDNARAAGEALPREAPPRAEASRRRTTAREPLPAARAAARAGARGRGRQRRDRRP